MDILGIDIGGSGMKAAPVDLQTGALRTDRFRIDTPQPATPKAMAKVVRDLARNFEWTGPIGVAFPARVKRGIVHTASNIDKSWLGKNAEGRFGKATGCPVYVLNDADAAGVAEMRYGAGRGHTGLVLLLTFGTGIGSALFLDGELVPNTELGHLRYRRKKSFEDWASDRIRKEENLSWEVWGKRVQAYLRHVEFLLGPDLIIIGGGVSRPDKFDQYAAQLKTKAELIPAQLENEAGIAGAAAAFAAASEAARHFKV